MKAAALQIIRAEEARSQLIPAHDGWNPLDGIPAPEYLPEVWIGPHVGLRLIAGFKTLALLPPARGPDAFKNAWPTYVHDWIDLLAQEGSDAEAKAQRANDSNRVRLQPSAQDVSRMEAALVWPGQYLHERPLILRIVQRVAMLRARGLDLSLIARRLKEPATYVRHCNRDGLDEIALGLNRDRQPVF